MIKIVGVRFRNAGKIYYFGPGNLDLTAGMHVIVETARGVELGTVMIPTREVNDDSVIQPLKPVIRIATEADEKTALRNREKEKEAFKICLEKIAKHKLDMKLVEAEYTFAFLPVITPHIICSCLACIYKLFGIIHPFHNVVINIDFAINNPFGRNVVGIYTVCIIYGRAESVLKSDKDFRCLWTPDVLSEK